MDAQNPLIAAKLTPVSERFVVHWGEMGTRWGVNRSVAQIHALLYLSERPLNAEEIADTLGVARSNVSNSLKELQAWQLARITHVLGDRRDHFMTSKDVWELFRLIVEGRRQRELAPTIATLRECLASPDFARESAESRQRIGETLQFIEVLTSWSDEMLRLKPETLAKVLKLGGRISKLIREDATTPAVSGNDSAGATGG
ncbi:MAG: MarR family transcriptional regulator [Sterolibacteriaceae bacterium]|uniref:HTH-type transcriptional regulator n=1 Tax=Candidatus Methylophosphatis roskildensis TaxID=2899263 RepID=A0A9D7HLR7_9PROT|nr:MarR family transcriptional regulator [Candidatus Methylophosphatis roskildensis]MBK7236289.1 MarR family transcriptional regulator [Sterolibacteriaceae bacterium]